MFDPSSRLNRARTFIRYGYVPEPNWDVLNHFSDDAFLALKEELAGRSEAELIAIANSAADAAFEEAFTDLRGDIVIPVSGGRDSRFILCMAMELGMRDRVTTLTWGIPGGLDHQISAKVSTHLGLRHELIDTTSTEVCFSNLKQAFDNGAHWTDLQFAHFNQAWRAIAPEATAIIGYMGGPPVGCHYEPGYESAGLFAAISAFEALNKRSDFGSSVIGRVRHKLIDKARISLPEQLDLVYRQEGYLRRIVAPPRLAPRTPLTHPAWMRTMYALPGQYRVSGNLFTKMLVQRFPNAFDIGTSGAYGQRADAPLWRRLAARRAQRVAQIVSNLGRTRRFATFNKYGDERDLLEALLQTLPDGTAPAAFARALKHRSASGSPQYAADVRLRTMLICNLACIDAATAADEAFAA